MAYIDAPKSKRRAVIKRHNAPDVAFSSLTIGDPDGNRIWRITWVDSLGAFQIVAVMNPGRISIQPITANSVMIK